MNRDIHDVQYIRRILLKFMTKLQTLPTPIFGWGVTPEQYANTFGAFIDIQRDIDVKGTGGTYGYAKDDPPVTIVSGNRDLRVNIASLDITNLWQKYIYCPELAQWNYCYDFDYPPGEFGTGTLMFVDYWRNQQILEIKNLNSTYHLKYSVHFNWSLFEVQAGVTALLKVKYNYDGTKRDDQQNPIFKALSHFNIKGPRYVDNINSSSWQTYPQDSPRAAKIGMKAIHVDKTFLVDLPNPFRHPDIDSYYTYYSNGRVYKYAGGSKWKLLDYYPNKPAPRPDWNMVNFTNPNFSNPSYVLMNNLWYLTLDQWQEVDNLLDLV
jgi:hypothetical protein